MKIKEIMNSPLEVMTIYRDGQRLLSVWWEPEGTLRLSPDSPSPNAVVSLTLREQHCGDRSEWYVETLFRDGRTHFHNMRFIAGFEMAKEEQE